MQSLEYLLIEEVYSEVVFVEQVYREVVQKLILHLHNDVEKNQSLNFRYG